MIRDVTSAYLSVAIYDKIFFNYSIQAKKLQNSRFRAESVVMRWLLDLEVDLKYLFNVHSQHMAKMRCIKSLNDDDDVSLFISDIKAAIFASYPIEIFIKLILNA